MTVELPLICGRTGETHGHTLIDDADYHRVGMFTWRLSRVGYAVRWKNGTTAYLHREIANLVPGDRLEVDHINRDRLDNRRSNLRVVTRAENAQNLPPQAGTSSHRGVSWDTSKRCWTAQAKIAGRKHHIGNFATEAEACEAASAYRAQHMPFSEEARHAA